MSDTFQRPGWYPDPDGAAGERWWNGSSWSDSKRGGAVTPAPVIPQPARPQHAVYSAQNPAPTRPDPYSPLTPTAGRTGIDTRANRNAFIGFITGLVSLFAGIPFLPVVAIVFSVMGMTRARQLAAQGAPSTLMVFAIVGLVSGIIAGVIGIITLVAFIAALATQPT